MRKLTKRYIISSLNGLNLSEPIEYERYYINDTLRIQRKNNLYQKETLDEDNNIIEKLEISKTDFLKLKENADTRIIRNSYLFLDDKRISIKEYLGRYVGLLRVEITFNSEKEEKLYRKEKWMGNEITDSPLAFDRYLCKLSEKEFKEELNKYLN
ncbi:MAG: hypothetical protein SO108_06895 [Bacilli bacterium]|nr:hypothetical protein [Bacilli bacterium]